jgi:succinyl-diaminopimelate desuccinylase
MAPIDPVELTRALVRCPSVTPEAGAALDLVEAALRSLGFACQRLRFGEVDNLFARLGTEEPSFAFAGHVDVVPPGDRALWSVDPCGGDIRDGMLWGRGAADMKSGVACAIAAIATFLDRRGPPRGSIALIITGDEEGPAVDGTVRILDWATAHGHHFDACLVAEPTSPEQLGDVIKIGRRGSAVGRLVARGRQGHTAYPQRADNAAHRLVAAVNAMLTTPLDSGSAHFEPSNLQVTTIDIGNPAGNVVPARAEARFNIRYNDLHDKASLDAWLRARCDEVGGSFELELTSSGDAFLTEPGPLTDLVADAVAEVTGRRPELSTSGGTSDARFIRHVCPVVELGLVGTTMHQVDEHVSIADIRGLTAIYDRILERWFG